MRKLTKDADRICRSKELKEVYQNFESMYDSEYLSNVFGFPILDVSSYERNIAFKVVSTNNIEEQKVCMASFPQICGQAYLIINEEDIDKAHKIGLQLMYI
jgi:predicted regulator of amino acid metabolism with ACT domain